MTLAYTVQQAKGDADKKTVTGSIVATLLNETAKSKTHADAHIKSEDFWTAQRTNAAGDKVGSTTKVDEHLKATYAKRSAHSMFDSAESSVEAIVGALNTPIGAAALNALLTETGVDLYSRTAVSTLKGEKQIVRANASGDKDAAAAMNKVEAEYVVVCLRRVTGGQLVIASAYPVESDAASKLENPGKDWYQKQGDKSVIKTEDALASATVVW